MASDNQVALSEPAKGVMPFINKLYTILNEGSSEAIEWSEGGKSFIVSDRDRTVKLFNYSGWQSFRSFLSYCGFSRVDRHSGSGSEAEFKHPDLQRGRDHTRCHTQQGGQPDILKFPFINKLYTILNDKGNSEAIQWSKEGDSFIVLNRKRTAELLNHKEWPSVRSSLNRRGFREVDRPEFEHSNFQRGRYDMLCHIRRRNGPRPIEHLCQVLGNEGNSKVIKWSEEGDSFIVLDRERAADLFGYNKWRSLQNSLTRLGFRMVGDPKQHASSRSEFKHPDFQRGQDGMLCRTKWEKRPDTIIPEGPLPLPASSQSAPQQILPSPPPDRMLDTSSLLDVVSAIDRPQESIPPELSELNEYLLQEVMASKVGDIRHHIPTNVPGNAATSLAHRSDDGGPQIDAHVLWKRQRLMAADSCCGDTHGAFAHITPEFTPKPTSPPPGPCVSTPAPSQAAFPTQNASHPTNSTPAPQSDPALSFNALQIDVIRNVVSQKTSSPQLRSNFDHRDPTPSRPILPAPSSSTGVMTAVHLRSLSDLPWSELLSALDEQDTHLHKTQESIQEVADSINPVDPNIEPLVDRDFDGPQDYDSPANTTGSEIANPDHDQVDFDFRDLLNLSPDDSSFSDAGVAQIVPPVPATVTQLDEEETRKQS